MNLKFRSPLFIAMLFSTIFLSTLPVYAAGFIIIRDSDRSRPHVRRIQPRPLVIKPVSISRHHVSVTIDAQVATTSVEQEFYNPNGRELEGEYIFPIPESAAFKEFSMFMGGREVKGEILEADKARGIYMSIVRRRKDPALLEYIGRSMFRAKVFPIPARGTVRIKLQYSELLNRDFGLATYRYPLKTEKLSAGAIDSVAAKVTIKSKTPLVNVKCPSHKAEVNITKNGTEAVISYEERNVRPDRDMIVYFGTTEKEIGLDLRTYTRVGEDGYFMMLLSPSSDATKAKIINRDIVFVFDTSGSMRGDKFEQEIAALKFGVQGLREGDRFNLLGFAGGIRTFRDDLVEYSDESRKAALEWLGTTEATGGTDINGALLEALRMQPGKDAKRPFMIVFLTDGEPTVGETTDADKIIANVKKANTENVRLFCFGIGSDLNVNLIDRLAQENHGTHSYITESENIEVKVSNFFEQVSSPVLASVKIRFNGITTYDTFPSKLPDLFRGTQLQLFGRFKGEGTKAITLTGYVNGEEKTFTFEEKWEGKSSEDFIPRLWAMRKIASLQDQIRLHGEKQELKDEILKVAKKWGLMSMYTSFLVVEERELNRRHRRIPPPRRPSPPRRWGRIGGG